MSLRKMTLLVVGLTFLGLIVVLVVTLEITLIRHFTAVEDQTVIQNVLRAQSVLERGYEVLDVAALTWARDLSADGSAVMPEVEGMQQAGVNLLVLARRTGQVDSARAVDAETGRELAVPAGTAEALAALQIPQTGMHGVLALPEGALMLAARPVGEQGLLVAGRWLNEMEIQRLGSSISLSLSLFPYDSPNLPSDFLVARSSLSSQVTEYTSPLDENTAAGYRVIVDIYGKPAYLMRVEQARIVYQNGRFVMNYLVTALITASLCFGAMTIVLLERLVLARVTRLNQEVGRIRALGDPSGRVTVINRDELSQLSSGINAMLAALEQMDCDLRRRVDELGALFDASQSFLAETGSAGILAGACRLAVERFHLDAAWIGSVDADELMITPEASSGLPAEQLQPVAVDWQKADQDAAPAAQVVRSGKMVMTRLAEDGGRWFAGLPVVIEGELRAVLCLYSSQEQPFDSGQAQQLQSLANLTGMALQNAQLLEQVLAGRQRLQAVSRRLVEVQEEERRKIALELHDEIGQILTGLKLLLDTSRALPAGTQAARLAEAQEVVNELIGRVRQMSLDLRPSMLDDLGLVPSLLYLFERYAGQTGIQVKFEHQGVEGQRFSNDYETAAYRVIQEGLTNAARYSGVQELTVRLWNAQGVIGVQVQDWGVGFDPEAVMSSGKSRGLVGMRERANLLGGRVAVESAPGQGTCLTVELPQDGVLERRKNAR